ncbi:MAG: leucine-rich repeat domain-containing protein [Ferruginibacter sp.]
MEDILSYHNWWNQLELQWQLAFAKTVLLHNNKPTEVELAALYNITTLRLAGPSAPYPNMQVELTNLSGIKNLPNLSLLFVTHQQISNVEIVSTLPLLKSLFLNNNCITSLKGIETLTDLEQLYVQHNQINSIKPVEQLTNLREFYVQDNCIASLDGLTEKHSDKLTMFICRPNEQLKQKEIIRAERELGIICR